MAGSDLTTDPTVDVLGLGCASVDDLLYVAEYPRADSKVPVLRRERYCGGLTSTALVAAARMGSKCMFAGVLGNDELSSLVTDRLAEEGIDLSHVTRRADARPIHSVIVVEIERATRTILFDPSGTAGAPDSDAVVQLVLASRVLFVDPYGVPGMIRAATAARGAGIPVVGDFEGPVRPDWPPLLDLVDHLIVSTDFATELTAESDPARAVEALLTDHRDTVIVTCGVEGSWCLTRSSRGRPMHVPAFRVKAVDTNGCGDVFHGAYASALAQGMGTRERIVFATAAAALKATRSGGQAGIPRRDEVEAFIAERAT